MIPCPADRYWMVLIPTAGSLLWFLVGRLSAQLSSHPKRTISPAEGIEQVQVPNDRRFLLPCWPSIGVAKYRLTTPRASLQFTSLVRARMERPSKPSMRGLFAFPQLCPMRVVSSAGRVRLGSRLTEPCFPSDEASATSFGSVLLKYWSWGEVG